MERLESYGLVRDINEESGQVSAVISTGDVARDGAIIEPGGWDFSNYDRNPIILWMHNDAAVPFARTVERIATESELIARAQFDMDDPMGALMFRKIKDGYVNATSVRWMPKRTEVRKIGSGKEAREVLAFVEQELLEWSFVTIPADPKALIMRADGQPLDVSAYMPKPEPEPEPEPIGESDAAKAAVLAASFVLRRRRRPSVDDLITRGLAKATGKTEERIRQEA